MKETEQILALFRRHGAYLEGHFQLSSGLHSPGYLQCALVLQYPDLAERLGQTLAERLRSVTAAQPGVVASPALGGLIIGHEVARALGVRHIFCERQDGRMKLRRGFAVRPDETAVVVEDVITTGGSSLEVVELLQQQGARVLAAGSIIDRSGGQARLGVPRVALAELNLATYEPQNCPLCAGGVPVDKPGSRFGA